MSNFYFRVPFASGGQTSEIPEDIQPSGAVSFTEGWGPDYSLNKNTNPAAKPVARLTMNELFNLITATLKQYEEIGTSDFITSDDNDGSPFPYVQNAETWFDDEVIGAYKYRSLVAANEADPTDATMWQREPFYISGIATGTADAITLNETVTYFTGDIPDGSLVRFTAIANVTGASTFALGTSSPVAIKKMSSSGLVDTAVGDINTGGVYELLKTGGIWLLLDPTGVTASDIENVAYTNVINDFTKYQNIPVLTGRVTIAPDTALTIPNNSITQIQFNEVPLGADPFGMWDSVNFRWIAPIAGRWVFTCAFEANLPSSTQIHALLLYLYKNGERHRVISGSVVDSAGTISFAICGVSGEIELDAGDYVEAWVRNTFTTNMTVGDVAFDDIGDLSTFEMRYVGPYAATPDVLLTKKQSAAMEPKTLSAPKKNNQRLKNNDEYVYQYDN